MTSTVLHIDASARLDGSISRGMSRQIVDSLNASHIVTRDVSKNMDFVDETWVGATFTPPEARSASQSAALAGSDILVDELLRADTIVIGTAMYNFTIPAALKAWVDQICRVGVTFQYGEQGPEGLVSGKKAIIAIATGGVPVGSDYDHASSYLRMVLGFLGITDVTIVDVDSLDTVTKAA